MKFALAVGILSRSLPFVSATTHDSTTRRQGHRHKVDSSSLYSTTVGAIERKRRHDVMFCDPSSDDPQIGVLSCGEGFFCNYDKDSSTGGTCESNRETMSMLEMISTGSRFRNHGILKNGREGIVKTAASGLEECDPMASPDIGILSCGGRYQTCVSDPTSSMGGFCMSSTSSRQLYHLTENGALCDPTSDYYMYFDCDCTGFDNATGTGNIPCTIFGEDYCIGILYPGCGGTCFTQTRNYTLSDFVASSYISCSEITGPYAQTLCFEQFLQTDACNLTINNKTCTSCAVVPAGNDTTISFDCTNAGGGVGTSKYVLDVVSIIYSCYTPNNFTCDICDGTLTNPYTIASIDGYSHECTVFERGLNESLCSTAAPLLAATCCGVVDEPTLSPTSTDQPGSTPTETVPSPGPGPESSIPSAASSKPTFTNSVGLSIGLAVAWLISVAIN